MSFQIVRIRSLYVSGIVEDDRACRLRPLPQCHPGEARSSTLHRPVGQRSAARHSLWAGQARTPFRSRSIASAPDLPEKEVRLRLVSFDARFILSGSVVHFVPDTSSEGERRRETAAAGVPLLCTPSLTDSQSGIATLALRSRFCRAYTLQGLQFLRCGYGIYADCAEPFGLVSVLRSNPCAYTPSPKPLPPARLTRPKGVTVLPSFDHLCQSRKDHNHSHRLSTVRLLPRLSACLLTLRKTERTMLTHRPFRLPTSRAVDMRTLQGQCIMEQHITQESAKSKYI